VALVHDPDNHEDDASVTRRRLRLRDQGVITAIGCGMNQTAMLERSLRAPTSTAYCSQAATRFSIAVAPLGSSARRAAGGGPGGSTPEC
jgi:hypothetical protein